MPRKKITVQTVQQGDLFRDNDTRQGLRDGRIVKVVSEPREMGMVEVENVEHWNEKLIGRTTRVHISRLTHGRDRQTGFTKVSH